MKMLEDIRDISQSHKIVNRIEACYKICYCIKQRQLECKGVVKATQNMGKGLHNVFKTVVKNISQDLPPLGESGSEVSHFIAEHRKFDEVIKLLDCINKSWLKATLKEIKNLINKSDFSSFISKER